MARSKNLKPKYVSPVANLKLTRTTTNNTTLQIPDNFLIGTRVVCVQKGRNSNMKHYFGVIKKFSARRTRMTVQLVESNRGKYEADCITSSRLVTPVWDQIVKGVMRVSYPSCTYHRKSLTTCLFDETMTYRDIWDIN